MIFDYDYDVFDVFLTFRKAEYFLESIIETSLRDAAIKTFIDSHNDEETRSRVQRLLDEYNHERNFKLSDEENKMLSALKAMERSRIVIVIFTPEFVESSRSLETLVNIMECHKTMNKPVLPLFLGVSQQKVIDRSKKGFEILIKKHLVTRDEELNWRSALAEAASLSDSSLSSANFSDRKNISNLIAKLDEYLFCDLLCHPVGLRLRVNEVLHLLEWDYIHIKYETRIIGIWGVGGIGKTTIARAIYDRIGGNFESKSFLANIKDVWEKDNGPNHLENQLISDISKKGFNKIHDVKMRRALVVLDDVNQIEQLKALCGSGERFGKGSFIFITTRNKHLLNHLKVKLYEQRKLDSSESLHLLSLHAFKKSSPTIEFMNLSRKAVTFCEGLPLALEVLGSLLHNRSIQEWKNVLEKFKGIPYGQTEEKLKISFDFLAKSEKDLFFNIACFYVGQSEHYVTQLLKGSRFPLEKAMRVLIERSLVKVDMNGKLHVHDLLQEMGKGINSNKPKPKYIYDVFLSFRGEDTRKSFATHLHTALKKAGFKVFMDDDGIERGKNISSSLLQAIESSRISIIIFSKNYAGSSWCLEELEKIMDCHRTTAQEVLPIFYDVRPSEVRKQQNAFGKAWKMLIKGTSASKVKKLTLDSERVLIEAANLSGWDMHNYRTETELIDHVIETITMKLDDNKCLFVAHHPVGLKCCVQDIIQLLSSKSNDVIIVGIWGMGGIGKTTIAKAIYNEIGQTFKGRSFLAKIKEVWSQDNGHVYLQEQLLSGILKRSVTLPSIEMGKALIKEILPQKRTLVVLDDVNNKDQLEALCGSREWFGQGSRIIITTRDEHLLQILQVVNVHNMKEMDDNESLELFSWHAFKQAIPKRDFIELSRRVVSYSQGLPLALEILGTYLFDRELLYWEGVLEKLQQIPNGQIYEILKISYDGLSDDTEKGIFLDICCFFIGKDRNYATQILNSYRLHADIGITHLIERCLVKVDNKNKFDMHDLLRDMGREIIRKQSPEEPEKHTRLWFHHDVLNVLINSTGTIDVKGLALNLSRNNSLSLRTKAFKKMKRLRLLQLNHVQLVGDYEYLSKELRWLCWHGFPLENMPMDLSLGNIVAIDLKYSNLTQAWKKSQLLEQLKILNLSHSYYLTQTPDFSMLPNLEKLILKDCPHLSMVHPSIGDLKCIVLLNLKDCKDLNHLPRSIYNLKSLKTLNVAGCSNIEKLEEDIEQMESLTTLMANQTAITQVPFSLVKLTSIKYVSLCGYEGLSSEVFPAIIWSWMSPTHNPKSLIQAFGHLPFLIQGLSHHSFAKSNAIWQTRPSTSQASCKKAPILIDFHKQVHIERSETFISSLTIHIGGFNKVSDTLLKSISQGWNDRAFGGNSLPKDNYPDWLNFNGEGSSVLFKVPQIIGRSLKGLILCIIYLSPEDSMTSIYPVSVVISNHTKATVEFYKRDATTTSKDEEWHNIIFNLEPGNEVEAIVIFACKLIVKKTVIYLVYDENVD